MDENVTGFEGISLYTGTRSHLAGLVERRIDRNPCPDAPFILSAVNAHRFVKMKEESFYHDFLKKADLVTADGMSIVWTRRLFGDKMAERVPTTDVFHDLACLSTSRPLRFYLLGATDSVVREAAEHVRSKYPKLSLKGYHHGYFPPEKSSFVVNSINDLQPDVLWVGMGYEREARWVAENQHKLNVPVIATCGGLMKFLAGRESRAPLWMQRGGMEWIYRLVQQPIRLGKRYTVGNLKFLIYMAASQLPGIKYRELPDSDPIKSEP